MTLVIRQNGTKPLYRIDSSVGLGSALISKLRSNLNLLTSSISERRHCFGTIQKM